MIPIGKILEKIGSRTVVVVLFLFAIFSLEAQEVGETEIIQVKSREWNLSFFLNTRGAGIGFQVGKLPDYRNKHYFETDFLYSMHYKQLRAQSVYWEESRPFCYGKLYDLFFWRVGYGYQRILHHKPYWGGVEVRYSFSFGFALGLGFPVYLDVLYVTYPDMNYIVQTERYDPNIHDVSNILGGAEWYYSFKGVAFRPGAYAKTGLSFDFSKDQYRSHILEVGISADAVFPFIQQMAFNNPTPVFLNAYISYSFGKKKGLYE